MECHFDGEWAFLGPSVQQDDDKASVAVVHGLGHVDAIHDYSRCDRLGQCLGDVLSAMVQSGACAAAGQLVDHLVAEQRGKALGVTGRHRISERLGEFAAGGDRQIKPLRRRCCLSADGVGRMRGLFGRMVHARSASVGASLAARIAG